MLTQAVVNLMTNESTNLRKTLLMIFSCTWRIISDCVNRYHNQVQTFHALHCEALHLGDEVLLVKTHDGRHKILYTFGSKSKTLQWYICGPTSRI